jgi:hypothetical protein
MSSAFAAAPAPRRLALARSIAWAVHTSGWLVLGAAGAQQLPQWFGGLLPTALWLGVVAAVLQAHAGRPLGAARVRMAWLLAALGLVMATTLSATAQPQMPVLVLALAWAAGAAAASWTVRLLRGPQRTPWRQALLPAVVGVAVAGAHALPAVLGSHLAGLSLPTALLIALGALLTWRRAPARQACRRGAWDEWRALQGLDAPGRRAAWAQLPAPQRLAAAAMLPMMAGLPTVLGLCTAGTGPAAMVVLHLGAMVVPAACLVARPRAMPAPDTAWTCAALLIAGALALPALPLLQGLTVAALLHTAAWSLAWAGGLQGGAGHVSGASVASMTTPRMAALTAAASLLLLGAALQLLGPLALWLMHAALGVLALLWVLARPARSAHVW